MVVLLCMQQETAAKMDTDGGILHRRMSNAGMLYVARNVTSLMSIHIIKIMF